ncbi:MAG: GGDEF domain-containing protein [Saccharofermentanales bacterium]|jgi:diguanylate cyclase (GGDEF)-like protein
MNGKLEAFLDSFLSRHSSKSDDEKYLFLFSNAACLYAAAAHLFLLFFFLAVGILPLFLIYLSGFLTDLLTFRLLSKGHYVLSGILLSLSVMFHAISSAIGTGADKLYILHLLVTFIMQPIIPYAKIRIRILMGGALWVCMMALLFIQHFTTPIWDIGNASITITLFNVHISIIAIAIQLTLGNVIRDMIMNLKSTELEVLKTESNTDALTGLFNRRYADVFFERLSTGRAEQNWCVAMLDIDNFKLINDTHGHQVGDSVLVSIGNTTKANLRKTDFVFRWGGEEFLILLKDIDISDAFKILDKVRNNIASESLETHGKNLNITVTIGVCPLDIHNVSQSIHTCDHLMYKGKTLGKNIVLM